MPAFAVLLRSCAKHSHPNHAAFCGQRAPQHAAAASRGLTSESKAWPNSHALPPSCSCQRRRLQSSKDNVSRTLLRRLPRPDFREQGMAENSLLAALALLLMEALAGGLANRGALRGGLALRGCAQRRRWGLTSGLLWMSTPHFLPNAALVASSVARSCACIVRHMLHKTRCKCG